MSATYWVLVPDELAKDTDGSWLPEGLRFTGRPAVPALPPYALGNPAAAAWRQVEDDGADESLEGRQVELVLGRRAGRPAPGGKGKPDAPAPQQAVIIERRPL